MRTDSDRIDYSQFPVLYVDDESQNLRSFEMMFRREFSVLKAESGAEALEAIATNPVAVVLSDHRMPEMTGTELLSRVREMAPATVRLLVTAYGDASTLAQAINEGCIYRYIPKPWDRDEMREIVRQSIELYALEEQQRKLLRELQALHEASRGISRQLEADLLSAVTLDTVVDEFGFDGATLLRKGGDQPGLLWVGTEPCPTPCPSQISELRIAAGSSSGLWEKLEAGETVLLEAARVQQMEDSVRSFIVELAADQLLVVPLHGRRGLVGALAVDNRRGGRGFRSAERQLLESLAAQAAIALDNAHLIGELRNDAARTSGADALAISGALGISLAREVSRPLESAVAAGAAVEGDLEAAVQETSAALNVFDQILAEQTPVSCDLWERVCAARGLTKAWARELDVNVQVGNPGSLKVEALPGRLLQLLLHLLEMGVARSVGGSVVVSQERRDQAVILEVFANPASPLESETLDVEADQLRVSACEALARELGSALEFSPESHPATWKVQLPLAV